ncbi:hypothetical protein [Companilactobacillus musae]|uniref:hypothetical protein n=1 Tax=Companilactobacillus musae TaxID=1903258 RepID=UPI00342D4356
MATTEAQKRATQAYRKRNRKKTITQSAKSTSKTYINKYITEEKQLDELEEWIEAKRKLLRNNKA